MAPRRPFGPAGVPVPVIGQGTWMMERDPAASVRALRLGLSLGMTHIDTAEMYGDGRVEEIVGEAVRGRREEVFLVSKVLPSNATFEGTLRACERSLKRLGTDRLDVYLLHWRERTPLEETFRAFERLLRDGKIRAYGVSNFDVGDLEEALRIAGPGRIACNQVLYHVRERAVEHEIVPWCERHGVSVVAYSPLGQGDVPGSVLADIARARNAAPAQIALAFLTRRGSVFAIPKSSSESHLRENAGAGSLALTEDEVQRLDLAFPRGRRRGLPTL